MVCDTLSGGGLPTCLIWKAYFERQKVTAWTRFAMEVGTDLTLRSKFKVKGHQQWYATHRLEVVYLHAKYGKITNLTLKSKVTNNGTRHIVWGWSTYMPNMKILSWTTKKLQPGHDLLRTDRQTDHYRVSVTLWRGPNYSFYHWGTLKWVHHIWRSNYCWKKERALDTT